MNPVGAGAEVDVEEVKVLVVDEDVIMDVCVEVGPIVLAFLRH
jgi:hypothetical protein